MQFKVELIRKFGDVVGDVIADIESENTQAVVAAGRYGHAAVRSQTEGALGRRTANAWRLEFFPKGAAPRAAYIFTRAPNIVRAFAEGVTIQGKKGNFLAIPTPNAPMSRGARGGARPMSIAEAVTYFSAKPRIVASKKAGTYLVLFPVVRSKSRKGFRRATYHRLRQGRNVIDVPMYILVRQVTLEKRLDLQRVTREAGEVLLREIGG